MDVARVTASITTSVSTFADVTGLTFSLATNTNYYFRFVLFHSSSATTIGIRFAVNGPASPTELRVGGIIPISTVGANFGSQTAYDTAIFASTTGTTVTVMSIVEGIIRNGSNAGTLACRWASEVNATANANTIQSGSLGFLQQF